MAGLVSFDDRTRTFVVEVNGVQQELAYPADLQVFTEFKDAGAYLKGFASLFHKAPEGVSAAAGAPSQDWL